MTNNIEEIMLNTSMKKHKIIMIFKIKSKYLNEINWFRTINTICKKKF